MANTVSTFKIHESRPFLSTYVQQDFSPPIFVIQNTVQHTFSQLSIDREVQTLTDQDQAFYEVLTTYISEKQGLGTIFMAEQDRDTTFYRTEKEKL